MILILSVHAESAVILIPILTSRTRAEERTGGGEEETDNSDEQLLFGVKHSCVRVLLRERPSSRRCVVFVPSWAPDSVKEMQTFPRISSNRIPLLHSSSHPSNAPSALTLAFLLDSCLCFPSWWTQVLLSTHAVLIVSMTVSAIVFHCIYVLRHRKLISIHWTKSLKVTQDCRTWWA